MSKKWFLYDEVNDKIWDNNARRYLTTYEAFVLLNDQKEEIEKLKEVL